jgi:NhaP-type Na+/H+ or K+/H+ antiporter
VDVQATVPASRKPLFRIPLRVVVVMAVLGCWWLADATGTSGLEESGWYRYATSLLLAIGLFASTAGIDRREAAAHKGLIVAAVTVGVVFKAALIGGVLYLASRDPFFLILGIAVAQIDPLSVAAILGDNRLSARAKTILASWASFDDPITVLLVVYASALLSNATTDGSGATASVGNAVASGSAGYGLDVALNLALAGAAYLAWRLLRRSPVVLTIALAGLAALAVWQFLMLAVAIAGLFVRPGWLERWLPRATNTALVVAGGVLGLLLVNGVNVWYGLALGVMAFLSQIVAGGLLTFGLPARDRLHLALAQQNGITAIILALQLEVDFDGAVAVIAPAILVTNTVHFVVNWLVDRRHHAQPVS